MVDRQSTFVTASRVLVRATIPPQHVVEGGFMIYAPGSDSRKFSKSQCSHNSEVI
jgi:hypothetical protein